MSHDVDSEAELREGVDEALPPPDQRPRTFLYLEQEAIARVGAGYTTYRQDPLKKRFTGLCFHCRWGFIIRAEHQNEPIIRCQELHKIMPTNVVECNKYNSPTELGLNAMLSLAWRVEQRDYLKDGYR